MMAPHGLGPDAIEIVDPGSTSTFLLVGEMVYLSQVNPGVRDPYILVLNREAGERLAWTILDLASKTPRG
jgi:hypothetical protein